MHPNSYTVYDGDWSQSQEGMRVRSHVEREIDLVSPQVERLVGAEMNCSGSVSDHEAKVNVNLGRRVRNACH